MSLPRTGLDRTLTLAGLIISGTLLGFYWQRLGDSGQLEMQKILLTCALTVGSYLVGFLIGEALRIRPGLLWVVASLIGSVLSAFNIQVKFLIINAWNPFSPPFLAQFDSIAFGFLVCAVFFSVGSLAILAAIHLLRRLFQRLSFS